MFPMLAAEADRTPAMRLTRNTVSIDRILLGSIALSANSVGPVL